MYLTIEETAEYLSLPESYIKTLIQQKRIRVIFDGEQHLIYKEQFNEHFEQLKKMKALMEELNNEPIPEDLDVHDED